MGYSAAFGKEEDMAKRSYKFTDKKHTRQGIISSLLGVAALALLAAGLVTAYGMAEGTSPTTALMGFLSMVFSVIGFVLGARGFREEEVYYLFSKIGIGLNGLLFVVWVLIFVAGM